VVGDPGIEPGVRLREGVTVSRAVTCLNISKTRGKVPFFRYEGVNHSLVPRASIFWKLGYRPSAGWV